MKLDSILDNARKRPERPNERKKLTLDQQRFAIEVFEACLNGAVAEVRSRGSQVKVTFIKRMDAHSV